MVCFLFSRSWPFNNFMASRNPAGVSLLRTVTCPMWVSGSMTELGFQSVAAKL